MKKEDISSVVTNILTEYVSDKELEIYRVQYKKEGPDWVLRVLIDKPMGAKSEYININECEAVTRYLNDKLDEIDIIEKSYRLEVSSPGLDRELIKESDYIRFAGRPVKVKTYEQINGNKQFTGLLIGKEDTVVTIETDGETIEIPEKKIAKINLEIVF